MKKENKKRRLTLNRETLQRLEEPQILEQVQGGTSQWTMCTSRTFNEASTDGC